MKPKANVVTLLVFILATGCASHQPTDYAPTRDTRRVKIETDPPGMRIYFGISGTEDRATRQREYVGESPCAVVVPCDEDGRFVNDVSSFARPKAIFEAEPPTAVAGLYAQKQVFTVPALFVRPPAIPRAIFFDMHTPP